MREIKFRAWDKHSKQMTTSFVMSPTSPDWAPFIIRRNAEANKLLNELDHKNGDPFGGDYTMTDWGDYYAINNLIVMQSTGLKDDDKKEIWEGDLIEFDLEESGKEIGVVRFSNSGFWTSSSDGGAEEVLSEELSDLPNKVIGNIYENPELLK